MTARLRIPHFSLEHTLECGQFFRFTKVLDTYILQSSGQIFSLRQRGESLFYDGVGEPLLIQFFRLDEDLNSICERDRSRSGDSSCDKKISRDEIDPTGSVGMPGLFPVLFSQGRLAYPLHHRACLQILGGESGMGKLSWLPIS